MKWPQNVPYENNQKVIRKTSWEENWVILQKEKIQFCKISREFNFPNDSKGRITWEKMFLVVSSIN